MTSAQTQTPKRKPAQLFGDGGNGNVNGNRQCYLSLASSIGSISLALGSLLQIPNITDRISLQRGLFLTSLGFIYFVSLTSFFNKYLLETSNGQRFRKKYRLMLSDVLEITNKIVSAIQAFFSFLVGLLVCKSACTKSFVYASHFLMEAYGWFGTAYFMYDIWSMYKVHTQKIADKLKLMRLNAINTTTNIEHLKSSSNGKSINNGGLQKSYDKINCNSSLNVYEGDETFNLIDNAVEGEDVALQPPFVANVQNSFGEIYDYDGESVQVPRDGKWDFLKYVITHPLMMIHHVFIGTFGLLVVTYIRGGGHCIYSYMYMMEFSTPFVSLRSILSTMHLKESRFYIWNGLIMLATFLIFRVLMWPYVMWRYSIAIDTTFWQAIVNLPRGCLISIMILFIPQIYWFFLMVKGAIKVLLPTKKSLPKESPDTLLQQKSKNNNVSPVASDSADTTNIFPNKAQIDTANNGNGATLLSH